MGNKGSAAAANLVKHLKSEDGSPFVPHPTVTNRFVGLTGLTEALQGFHEKHPKEFKRALTERDASGASPSALLVFAASWRPLTKHPHPRVAVDALKFLLEHKADPNERD